jgi:sugar phosphate permease
VTKKHSEEIMNSNNLKRYFQFLLVVLSAGSIYPLIYLRSGYGQTILEVFGMTNTQLNGIYSILGLVFVIGYFPSGVIADKFSAKKLLVISLLMTGLGGLWFAQIPDYSMVRVIFAVWGVFSVFTFWSAHMKLVKLLSHKDEEGRFFGILDGGRGLVEAILASVALFIFSRTLGGSTDAELTRSALVSVIYMYSFVMLALSVLVAIFVSPDTSAQEAGEKAEKAPAEKFKPHDIIDIFKNPAVIMLGLIIFTGYIVTWSLFYWSSFMQSNIGVTAVTAATVMLIVNWMRPVGGIIGGVLADKVGKANVLTGALILGAIFIAALVILPVTLNVNIFFVLVIGAGLFVYVIRGLYWSLLGDINIKENSLGISIGFISLLGYLPDILLPLGINVLVMSFGDEGYYTPYFLISAGMGLLSVVFVFIFRKLTAKQASVQETNEVEERVEAVKMENI